MPEPNSTQYLLQRVSVAVQRGTWLWLRGLSGWRKDSRVIIDSILYCAYLSLLGDSPFFVLRCLSIHAGVRYCEIFISILVYNNKSIVVIIRVTKRINVGDDVSVLALTKLLTG